MCGLVSLLTDKFILRRIILFKLIRLLFLSVVTTTFGFLTPSLRAQFVYVLADTPQEQIAHVWAYQIDPTGSLTPVPGSPFGVTSSFSGALAVDPKGRYLYVADTDDNVVWEFGVEANGALTPRPIQYVFTDGIAPSSITIDPTGKFIYVVNLNVSILFNNGPPTIDAYSVGPKGKLTRVPGSPFLCGSAAGQPLIDQTSRHLYTANGISKNVTGFNIGTDGALTPIAGSPFGAGLAPLATVMDPRGKFIYEFAYIPATLVNVVAVYGIAEDGVLIPVPGSPFSYAPGLFPFSSAVDPAAHFLYLANLNSANISAYGIEARGLLQQIQGSPFPTTDRPTIIGVEPLRGFVYVESFYGSSIFGYKIGKNGSLTPIPNSPFVTGPESSAIAIKSP